jgi:hypothetical protein
MKKSSDTTVDAQTFSPVCGRVHYTRRACSPDEWRVVHSHEMRVSLIGKDPSVKRSKSSMSESLWKINTIHLCVLFGTKRDQVFLSEVPFVMLEELEVVFFEVFGTL